MRKIILPPVLLVACLIGMIALSRYGSPTVIVFGWAKSFGYLLIALGIFLPVWGAQIFKKKETNILPYKSPDKMVTQGPFRLSRNPMYLGMLLVLLGVAIRTGAAESFLFAALFFAVANWWYIPFEEVKMAKVFGQEFDDYKAKVRRWL